MLKRVSSCTHSASDTYSVALAATDASLKRSISDAVLRRRLLQGSCRQKTTQYSLYNIIITQYMKLYPVEQVLKNVSKTSKVNLF